jgi:hypothetical protein
MNQAMKVPYLFNREMNLLAFGAARSDRGTAARGADAGPYHVHR